MHDAESGSRGDTGGVGFLHIFSFARYSAVYPCKGFVPNERPKFRNGPRVGLGGIDVEIAFDCESVGSDL